MMRTAFPDAEFAKEREIPHPQRAAALIAVWNAVRKRGAMPTETAWRMMREIDKQMPPFGEHDPLDEIPLTVFVAVLVALMPMADRQQAAFDQAADELARERKRSVFRKRRAARRALKEARKADRPEKVRAFINLRASNREAPRVAPVKTAARQLERDGHGDVIRTRTDKTPAAKKPAGKAKGPVGKGGKR